MYADDTQLYYSFDVNSRVVAEERLNEDLERLSNISSSHSLILNPSKSAVIIFGKKTDCLKLSDLNIKVNSTKIHPSTTVKNLGLILDQSLRFREHVSKIIQKAYAALKLLYPHRASLDHSVKKRLCESLVMSQFTYCSQVYGPCLDQDSINRIQRVQNSCIRYIFGIRKYDHVSHKLKDLCWLNMKAYRERHALCMFHKIIVTKQPSYLYNKISFRSDVHNINIRSRGELTSPPHRTALFERSFKFNIYKLYNSIPQYFKSYTVKKFSIAILDHLSRL